MKRVTRICEGRYELLSENDVACETCVIGNLLILYLLYKVSKKFSSPFSKVFFVKGKEGKRPSRSFSAGCERAWADPERRREPTTEETNARHQHKDSRQNKNRNQGRTRSTSRTRHPKEEQKIRLKLDENTDTVTEKHNFCGPQFSGSPAFFHSAFLLVFNDFCKLWKCRKYKNHKSLILHPREIWKVENLKVYGNQKTAKCKKRGTCRNLWSDKN